MDERFRRAADRAGATLHNLRRPVLRVALLFVASQVIFSQSRTARAAWAGAKRRTPYPVRAAAGALGQTPVGRAVRYASAGVHHGADWVFRPFRATVAAQERRADSAAAKVAEHKRRAEEARATITRLPDPEPVVGTPVEQ